MTKPCTLLTSAACLVAFLILASTAPAQNAVATVFSKVGITLPRADGSDQDQEGNDLPTRPVGPDLSGPARKGLCTASSAGKWPPSLGTA